MKTSLTIVCASCKEFICMCASTKVEDITCIRDMWLLGKSLHTVIWVEISVPCFNFGQVSKGMLKSMTRKQTIIINSTA